MNNHNVMASTTNDLTENVTIYGEEITVTTRYLEDEIVVVGVSENGTENKFVYDKINNVTTIDGEIIDLNFETTFEEDIKSTDNQLLAKSSSAYTPIYSGTSSISFNKTVTSIGAIATVVGGVIAIAALAGISLPSIAGVISNWASVIGLGTLIGGYYVSGEFSYNLYRTSKPVQFGIAAWPQIAYRYQNYSVNFKVKGKTMYHNYTNVGSWWYASKPYYYSNTL